MRIVTLFGKPLTLEGRELRIGDKVPDFVALDKQLKEVKLSDFKGKIKVISVTPSLDTPVCDLQARTFNQRASQLPGDVIVMNISMDLPFAIERFCTQASIENILVLSDHREASFGLNYGLLIKELRLLARAVLIIDKNDVLRYIEIVPEVTSQPNYERALSELNELLQEVST